MKKLIYFLISLFCFIPIPALSATWYVSTTGNNSNAGTSGAPWASINYAIATSIVSYGDTLSIAAGNYYENVIVSKPLTIMGAGQNNTTIYPAISGPVSGSNIVLLQANNIIVHDLILNGDNPNLFSGVTVNGADIDARNGILTDYSQPSTFLNTEIYNITVKNIYHRGIEFYCSLSTYVSPTFNCHDNTVTNVDCGDGTDIAIFNEYGYGTFARNFVSQSNDAIHSNWSGGTLYLNNTVTNCASGIETDNAGWPYIRFVCDTIQGNVITSNVVNAWGITIYQPYASAVVSQNAVSLSGIGSWGLVAAGNNASETTLFASNTVNGNNTAGSCGAFVTNDGLGYGAHPCLVNFSNNVISYNAYGLFLEETAAQLGVTASGNYLAYNGYAVYAVNSAAGTNGSFITMPFNNIYNNTTGITNIDTLTVVTALNCWWGSASGPYHSPDNTSGLGNPVSDRVVFNPFAGGFVPVELSCFTAEETIKP